jgi:hypothetical protein
MKRQEKLAMWILLGFILTQILCQLVLLAPQVSSLRIGFRVVVFFASIMALFFIPTRGMTARWLIPVYGVLIIYLLNFLHPDINTPLSAIASIMLNLAIIGPAIWILRLHLTPAAFSPILHILWAFNSLSALMGCMQVFFPGSFDFEVVRYLSDSIYADGLKITLSDGSRIWRPTGLSDSPGGASPAGLNAILMSTGILLSTKNRYWILPVALSICMSVFCIFLCQIRVVFVTLLIDYIVLIIGLYLIGRPLISLGLAILAPVIITLVFLAATYVGGDSTISRFETLFMESPDEVYYSNRGKFLEATFDTFIYDYPLGAGLGRWGNMNAYFGVPENTLWVEIQWTAWVFDGGIPLMVMYLLAVLAAAYSTLSIGIRSSGSKRLWTAQWAILITGYNVGVMALFFSYVPFIGQVGMEFWILNAAIYVIHKNTNSMSTN